ncbi:Inherit from NOG: Serine repeat antigen [Seminavis robusta]|uniref:Circumsporozoite protein n=1 Tax=Seminavis robusta TaxID=568900 RepID=A0A9N8D9D0_9STRA|nr:Inherit from NOG: Serine repeat antigen [Seminavis robusta]|eukprot:Sro44_g026650.1 Inherit from NOG: Serine repeat antigen (1606) ;mRNA; r:93522-98553
MTTESPTGPASTGRPTGTIPTLTTSPTGTTTESPITPTPTTEETAPPTGTTTSLPTITTESPTGKSSTGSPTGMIPSLTGSPTGIKTASPSTPSPTTGENTTPPGTVVTIPPTGSTGSPTEVSSTGSPTGTFRTFTTGSPTDSPVTGTPTGSNIPTAWPTDSPSISPTGTTATIIPATGAPTRVGETLTPTASTTTGTPTGTPGTGSPTGAPVTSSPTTTTTGTPSSVKICYPEVVLEEETFETSDSSEPWSGGSLFDSETSGQFLGLLDDENPQMSNTYEIPLFSGPEQEGAKSGIQWTRVTPEESISVNDGPTDDTKHTISLTIPSDLIEDDSPTSLTLGFQVDSPNPNSEESYGVDDLKITALYTCEKTESPSAVTTGAPTSTTGTPTGSPVNVEPGPPPKTSSPTGKTVIAPSASPSDVPLSKYCEISIEPVAGTETFEIVPIEVASTDGETISFDVFELLTTEGDGDLSWMAAVYTAVDETVTCDERLQPQWGSNDMSYSALCVEGYANVELYFHGLLDSGDPDLLPEGCEGLEAVVEKRTAAFMVTIPCDPSCYKSEAPNTVAPIETDPTASPVTPSPTDGTPSAQPSWVEKGEAIETNSPSAMPSWIERGGSLETNVPSSGPSTSPTTREPTTPEPSTATTEIPSYNPSLVPTTTSAIPTTSSEPSASMSDEPSSGPSETPSSGPTAVVSENPTVSMPPTVSMEPTSSTVPSAVPSVDPTGTSSASPTGSPSASPSAAPSVKECYDEEVVVVDENFESFDSSESWNGGSLFNSETGSQFLGLLGTENPEITNTYEIPLSSPPEQDGANSVTVSFTLYQLDSSDSSTTFYAVINDEPIEFGNMDPTGSLPGSSQSGSTDSGIKWTRVTPEESLSINDGSEDDKKHTITLTIPSSLIEDDTPTSLTVGFQVDSTNPTSEESYGIDDLTITAVYICGTEAPTSDPSASPTVVPSDRPSGLPSASPSAAPSVKECYDEEVVVVDESFESSDSSESWNGGSLFSSETGGQFLGLLGTQNPEMTNTYEIPVSSPPQEDGANNVTVSFTLYQLDSSDSSTTFYAVINGEPIEFGSMDPTESLPGSSESGSTDSGIKWTRVTPEESLSINDGSEDDKKHTITLTIPSSLIEDDKPTSLTVGFQVDSTNPTSEESYGIDDLTITAVYICGTEAPTSDPSASPTVVPSDRPSGLPSASPSAVPSKECYDEVVLEEEDFESSDSSGSWNGGSLFNSVTSTQILGLLGTQNPEVTNSYEIPVSFGGDEVGAYAVTVNFTIYQLDSSDSSTKFYAVINDENIDFGNMNPTESLPGGMESGSTDSGITWTRVTPEESLSINDGSVDDKKHTIALTIPSSMIEEEAPTSLALGFLVDSPNPNSEETYGVDDLTITSFYTCVKTRTVEKEPTATPSVVPSPIPSNTPSSVPSVSPSGSPSAGPSVSPSQEPTGGPTIRPSQSPSQEPTGGPTIRPSESPSQQPTGGPTIRPSQSPSGQPTGGPTLRPSESPSGQPTGGPTPSPSESPSGVPSESPSGQPTEGPTPSPSASPSEVPSESPSSQPTGGPTLRPSESPSGQPTGGPTPRPSESPSGVPSESPSGQPTGGPTPGPVTF